MNLRQVEDCNYLRGESDPYPPNVSESTRMDFMSPGSIPNSPVVPALEYTSDVIEFKFMRQPDADRAPLAQAS